MVCRSCKGKVVEKEGHATGWSVFYRDGRNLSIKSNHPDYKAQVIEEADIPNLFRYILGEFGDTLPLSEEELEELQERIDDQERNLEPPPGVAELLDQLPEGTQIVAMRVPGEEWHEARKPIFGRKKVEKDSPESE